MTSAIVSNIDGAALEEAFAGFDPAATLVVVASKTFTTTETMLNAQFGAANGCEEAGVDDPYGRVIALTAIARQGDRMGHRRDPHPAVRRERRRALFALVVGRLSRPRSRSAGRRSRNLLEGAAEMDRHFRLDRRCATTRRCSPPSPTAIYAKSAAAETRAVFAYDERLRLLPAYLQQLEMESNGKSVTLDGKPRRPADARRSPGAGSAPTRSMPCSSCSTRARISCPSNSSRRSSPATRSTTTHHRQLLLNCLRAGRGADGGPRQRRIPHATIRATGPSTTILLDRLDPRTLGALIAFYEHRTFANAVLLGINPFDQFGVELGKEMAKGLAEDD